MSIQQFNIDQGYTIFSEANYQTKKHTHYAIEVVCCAGGSFNISTSNTEYANIKSVIIPSSLAHSFSCSDATCDLLFLDPLSAIGLYLLQEYNLALLNNIIINPPGIQQWYKNGSFDISFLLNKARENQDVKIDPRITTCIQTINAYNGDTRLTVDWLAKTSFISGSRLAHLFKKQTGISVHQCILWKKILLAVQRTREGYSLTEAAHDTGFSDSSHFNKVFNRMFGVNPFFVLKT